MKFRDIKRKTPGVLAMLLGVPDGDVYFSGSSAYDNQDVLIFQCGHTFHLDCCLGLSQHNVKVFLQKTQQQELKEKMSKIEDNQDQHDDDEIFFVCPLCGSAPSPKTSIPSAEYEKETLSVGEKLEKEKAAKKKAKRSAAQFRSLLFNPEINEFYKRQFEVRQKQEKIAKISSLDQQLSIQRSKIYDAWKTKSGSESAFAIFENLKEAFRSTSLTVDLSLKMPMPQKSECKYVPVFERLRVEEENREKKAKLAAAMAMALADPKNDKKAVNQKELEVLQQSLAPPTPIIVQKVDIFEEGDENDEKVKELLQSSLDPDDIVGYIDI